MILASLDSNCMVGETGHHKSLKNTQETVQQIVTDLINENTFQKTPAQEGYPSFSNFNSNFLASPDYREVYTALGKNVRNIDFKYFNVYYLSYVHVHKHRSVIP